ncbi:unnamed protein product [Urochloa humidicola]
MCNHTNCLQWRSDFFFDTSGEVIDQSQSLEQFVWKQTPCKYWYLQRVCMSSRIIKLQLTSKQVLEGDFELKMTSSSGCHFHEAED